MRDITGKRITLRTALAHGKVKMSPKTVTLVKNNEVPKGNILEFARAAAFLGAKATPSIIPHCHPVAIEGLEVNYTFEAEAIAVSVSAKTIARTGIEMEALTAVSVACLTLYDTLKPLKDPALAITDILLEEKTGGKTSRASYAKSKQTAKVFICSDAILNGDKEDNASQVISDYLEKYNCTCQIEVISNDQLELESKLLTEANNGTPFLFCIGGTGLSNKDRTFEAVISVLEFELHGVTEAMRIYGDQRSGDAMFSRTLAGVHKDSVILTLPGSSGGLRESLEAVVPEIFKAAWMIKGKN